MRKVVLPFNTSEIAFWISSSVAESMAEVESSKIKILGSDRNARAIAIRWRSPPLSITPRSPTRVWYPWGIFIMKAWVLGVLRCLDNFLFAGFTPKGNIFGDCPREEEDVLFNIGNLLAQGLEGILLYVNPIDADGSVHNII